MRNGLSKGGVFCLVQPDVAAYIYLNGRDGTTKTGEGAHAKGVVARSQRVKGKGGDTVAVLDFDDRDVLIGIEILSAEALALIPRAK